MSNRARPLAEIGVLRTQSEHRHNRHNLLVSKVLVENSCARCLIDSGTTHNFVSESFINDKQITTTESKSEMIVSLADGRNIVLNQRTTCMLDIDLGGFQWQDSLTVVPMAGYDVVLGKPWLSDYNPVIDFQKNLITLMDESRGQQVTVECLSDKDDRSSNVKSPDLEFMTIKQARRELNRGAECIIVRLECSDDTKPDYEIMVDGEKRSEILNLLKKHKCCFPKELPARLPPMRNVNHEIDVEPGTKPPSRPPYRLSQPEMEELQRQLENLLKLGFIEACRSPYGAPVFFVKKADGSLRLVCDWRPLN